MALDAAAFGEWSDEATKARIEFIIAEGVQGTPDDIRASLPQSYDTLVVGAAAPTAGLSLTTLGGASTTMEDVFAAGEGRATLLNFGSYT
jgi:hypothetical protein